MTNEELALDLSENRKRLKQRLLEARAVLSKNMAVYFKKYTYSFEDKCIISECGRFKLQWKLRERPHEPESYANQQTSRGTVMVAKTERMCV